MTISSEDNPSSPGQVRHPGAYTPGTARTDRSAEYGGPADGQSSSVTFQPQRPAQRTGQAGDDIPAPDLPSIIGPAPAIGEIRR
jgi:hypothetical protein